MVLGIGLMQGMFGIISAVTWPRFYGRTHLGAISGFSTSIVVAGTAVGPYLFSVAHDQFGTYRPATLLCAVVALILLVEVRCPSSRRSRRTFRKMLQFSSKTQAST